MLQTLQQYWALLAVVILVIVAIAWALSGRRKRNVKIDDATAAAPKPTLARSTMPPEIPAVAPVPVPATPLPPAHGDPDDLLQLKGVGPKLVTLLGTLGITRFDQIAALSQEEIADIDAQLGTFTGRIERDRWVEQARFLAAGDVAGFEGAFGRLDGGKL